MTSQDSPESPATVLDEIGDAGDGEKVSFGEVLDAAGGRNYGPLLLIPGLITVAPTGAIPGVPTAMAVLVALVALQMVFRSGGMWLPGVLTGIEIDRERVRKSVEVARPWAERVSALIRSRLTVLVKGPAIVGIAVAALCAAVLVPPLELVPYAAFAPGIVFVVLGLGLTFGDGVWTAAGIVAVGVLVGVSYFLLQGRL